MQKQKPIQQQPVKGAGWKGFIIILLILIALSFVISGVLSLFLSGDDGSGYGSSSYGNVALIPLHGVIAISSPGSFMSEDGASSTSIVAKIEEADRNPAIKAIVIEINSPGGAPVASKEIVDALKAANKTTVAWIREVGASGAYWAASATDHVIADDISIVGSIGVNAAYLDFSQFIKKYNVTYVNMTKGKYKDTGNPFEPLSGEEREYIDQKLTLLYGFFKDDVMKSRNIPPEVMDDIAQGQIFLGMEAKDLGLVDELGGKRQVTSYLEGKLGETVSYKEYVDKRTILDVLSGLTSNFGFDIGRGIGSELTKQDSAVFRV